VNPDSKHRELTALFDQYFLVAPADTPRRLDDAYRLRYQVYCVENAFENPAEHPDLRERDKWDAHSRHAVLIYRVSGDVVGSVRVILPVFEGEFKPLPIHSLLAAPERRELERYEASTLGEVSRYAVSKQFRRRAGEQVYPDVNLDWPSGADARRLAPHISLGLIRAVAQLADQHHVAVLCAAMAPALLRLLERFGLAFSPLGPPIEYHGLRQPCLARVDDLMAGLIRHDEAYGDFVKARSVPSA
jgi:N-acyl amino acid synthase of PEP-CTERM/exosortase system